MARKELKSYMEVHAKLVEAMQEACTRDESGTYEKTNVAPGFIYEETNFVNKSRSNGSRFSKIAAIFIIVLLGMNLITLSSDSSEVYGEKGLLHRIFEGTRGIFTDEDESELVVFDETGDECLISNYDDIYLAKQFWTDLYIPEYIPEGYEFSSLCIIKSFSEDYTAEYEYVSDTNILEINFTSSSSDPKYISINKGELFELNDRTISIYKNDTSQLNIADIYLEDVTIHIYARLEEKEILRIAREIHK